MKRFLSILILFGALQCSAFVQITQSNVNLSVLGDSFFASSAGTGYRIPDQIGISFARYYRTNLIRYSNPSRSGGLMDDQLTNQIPRTLFAFHGWRSNNYQQIVFSHITQNGSLQSNAMYLALSNNFLAPAIMSSGGSTLASVSGWAATHPYQWYALGDFPTESLDGGSTDGTKYRDDAGTNAGTILGSGTIPMWGILRPSFTNDYGQTGGTNVQWFNAPFAGHPGSGGDGAYIIEALKQMLPDTNVADASIDWSGAINSTNHCVLYSVSKSGNTLTFSRLDDRLYPVIEFPGMDGRGNLITNDDSMCFNLNPTNGNAFGFWQRFTGLPAGNYSIAIDGTNCGTFTSAMLMSPGWNMWTNRVGPYALQASATLALARQYEYVDAVTLIPGSAGDNQGLVSYGSFINSFVNHYGDQLLADMTAMGDQIQTNLVAIHNSSLPLGHTFTVTQIQPRFAPAVVETAPDLNWRWNEPTNGPPFIYELQIVTDLTQWNTPPMAGGKPSPIGTRIFPGQRIWLHETNYPVRLADAPNRFAMVRAWNDTEPSDWALVAPTINYQLPVAPKAGEGGSTKN